MHALELVSNKSLQSQSVFQLHEEAQTKAKNYRRCEIELLEVLTKVEARKLYHQFDLDSMLHYCMELLKLPRYVSLDLINVMRVAVDIPEITEAIRADKLTVSKARKICSVVTKENFKPWLDLAIECSTREVERAVAQANPRAAIQESLKYVSGDILDFRIAVSDEWANLLKSTKDLLSQRGRRNITSEETLFILMAEFKAKNDPVEKAKRALKRTSVKQRAVPGSRKSERMVTSNLDAADSTSEINGPLPTKRFRHRPSRIDHEVNLRDGGQCTHIKMNGERCSAKRWIESHHIVPFAKGGAHTAENLVTLCWRHHHDRHN